MTRRDIDYDLVTAIEKIAVPLTGAVNDYDAIVDAAVGKKFVLIGEASHGTKEFYAIRAEISRRLIQEQGFDAVAVEADWPDAYGINRYVSFLGNANTALESLDGFERFPTWMWRNTEVLHFINWLHSWNAEFHRPMSQNKYPVGFYGLDLYSMNTSIHAVIDYLDKVDPVAAERARERYGCLDHFMDDPQAYGYATESGLADSCENEIVAQLRDIQHKAQMYQERNGFFTETEYFCATQNAKLVRNAEQYYRSMFSGRKNSWNVRDKHMFETLNDLSDHLGIQLGRKAKIIVWAHNSHIGNAGATEMGRRGEYNIGQLACDAYGADVLLVGFSTSHGTVTAASNWDEPPECKNINLPCSGSYEEVFHHVKYKNFLIDLRENNSAIDLLMQPRLQRAIGVIYRPMTERQSHYFQSCLPEQFDFMIHIDNTNAVQPLETVMHMHHGEMDETYPYGL
jgi:erythromycin esterase-like protein